MTRSTLEYVVSNLYDGGWTSQDADEIRSEYNLTEEELEEVLEGLRELEEVNNVIA